MNVFIMHVGHTNIIDIDYTMKRRRSIQEILDVLPDVAPERPYFANDRALHTAFPDGMFNCWGVPPGARPAFNRTEIGDLVLFAPWIGVHDGGIYYIGVVRAICPHDCWYATKALWPQTPERRPFPLLFFFDAEFGFHDWYTFLDDVGIAHNWHPRGYYRRIQPRRLLSSEAEAVISTTSEDKVSSGSTMAPNPCEK
jgi:hypothetical protein